MKHRLMAGGLLAAAALVITTPANATELLAGEASYLFNTLFLLFAAFLVMFMAAGFAMLEAGMVRSKSVAVICTKNIMLYALAGIAFFAVGYQLMYGSSTSGLIGELAIWRPDDSAVLSGEDVGGHASSADWFFQMVFVATAASIVSGAVAERVRFWSFAIFVLILAGVIYPLVGHWTWGGGWLAQEGFKDFAGSTIVHSVGGWAALTGIILLGARRGRFDADGTPRTIPPSSLPNVTLGTFILWLGWFGFNGGSQLAFSSTVDAVAVANVIVNTNLAAAGGVVMMAIATQLLSRRLDLPLILSGALAGLVSITAEPVTPSPMAALLIGAAGALVMMIAWRLLERLRLDDVVGAVPVHLAAGVWGTLAVALTNPEAELGIQTLGVLAIGAFVAVTSLAVWAVLRVTMGIRLHAFKEETGGDLSEVGLRAYELS